MKIFVFYSAGHFCFIEILSLLHEMNHLIKAAVMYVKHNKYVED